MFLLVSTGSARNWGHWNSCLMTYFVPFPPPDGQLQFGWDFSTVATFIKLQFGEETFVGPDEPVQAKPWLGLQ